MCLDFYNIVGMRNVESQGIPSGALHGHLFSLKLVVEKIVTRGEFICLSAQASVVCFLTGWEEFSW